MSRNCFSDKSHLDPVIYIIFEAIADLVDKAIYEYFEPHPALQVHSIHHQEYCRALRGTGVNYDPSALTSQHCPSTDAPACQLPQQ